MEEDVKASGFLKSHGYGILGVTRRDGTSQQVPIVYQYDGTDIIINSGDNTAKLKNLQRLPKASLAVPDDRDVVVINANVEIITDPELMTRLRQRMPLPPPEMLARFPEWGNQVVLRLTPTSWGIRRIGGPRRTLT